MSPSSPTPLFVISPCRACPFRCAFSEPLALVIPTLTARPPEHKQLRLRLVLACTEVMSTYYSSGNAWFQGPFFLGTGREDFETVVAVEDPS